MSLTFNVQAAKRAIGEQNDQAKGDTSKTESNSN
jgi:hypothetical protein